MNSDKNKRILILLILSVITVLVFSIWFSFFLSEEKKKLIDSIGQVRKLKTENIVEMKHDIKFLNPAVIEMNNFFIDSDAVVDFINKIEELAKTVGLNAEIQNVKLEDKERTKKEEIDGSIVNTKVRGGGELILSIQTRGSWNEIMDFLSILEKIDKKIAINGLRLSSSVDGESTKIIWTAIFNISVLTN